MLVWLSHVTSEQRSARNTSTSGSTLQGSAQSALTELAVSDESIAKHWLLFLLQRIRSLKWNSVAFAELFVQTSFQDRAP